MDLDPEGGLDFISPQAFWRSGGRHMDTLDVAEASYGRETGSSIQDQYGNNRGSHVDLRPYLVFLISPSPLIGFWSGLALTEIYSPGKSKVGLGDRFGAELAENIG